MRPEQDDASGRGNEGKMWTKIWNHKASRAPYISRAATLSVVTVNHNVFWHKCRWDNSGCARDVSSHDFPFSWWWQDIHLTEPTFSHTGNYVDIAVFSMPFVTINSLRRTRVWFDNSCCCIRLVPDVRWRGSLYMETEIDRRKSLIPSKPVHLHGPHWNDYCYGLYVWDK